MGFSLPTTAEELVQISAAARSRGERCELVNGEVAIMSPAGWKHGKVVSRIQSLLATFISEHDLGVSFGAETGFLISRNPDTVRAPDFAFVAKGRLPDEEPSDAYWPGPPDLAIEVLSPSDVAAEVQAKTQVWLDSGVGLLWNVDYEDKSVSVHMPDAAVQTVAGDQFIESPTLLPGFRAAVSEFFR